MKHTILFFLGVMLFTSSCQKFKAFKKSDSNNSLIAGYWEETSKNSGTIHYEKRNNSDEIETHGIHFNNDGTFIYVLNDVYKQLYNELENDSVSVCIMVEPVIGTWENNENSIILYNENTVIEEWQIVNLTDNTLQIKINGQ